MQEDDQRDADPFRQVDPVHPPVCAAVSPDFGSMVPSLIRCTGSFSSMVLGGRDSHGLGGGRTPATTLLLRYSRFIEGPERPGAISPTAANGGARRVASSGFSTTRREPDVKYHHNSLRYSTIR